MKLMSACIRIRFLATFKQIVGKEEITLDFQPETTLGQVLNTLAEKYGKDFEETVDKETGQIDVNTLVMLNGQNVRDTSVKLKANDLVIVTVPLGGG